MSTNCSRVIVEPQDIEQLIEKNISDFATANTMKIFERFEIDTSFLNHDSATWFDR